MLERRKKTHKRLVYFRKQVTYISRKDVLKITGVKLATPTIFVTKFGLEFVSA